MKKLKISKDLYPDVHLHLIEVSAITMPKWEKEFSVDMLEEVYEIYPSALAAGIRTLMSRSHKTMLDGVNVF
jgi:hypothetical protein